MTDSRTASTSAVIYEPGKIVSISEECAGEVRWSNPGAVFAVLWQKWLIHGIGTTGAVESTREEWRRVPNLSRDRL